MIEHVYRRASEARSIASVIVATDDQRIVDAVTAFGGNVRLTAATHQSGTDRLAEVAEGLTCDLVVNVQGDEPLIEPATIDAAVAPLAADPSIEMSTLCQQIDDPAERTDPNVTKVVLDDRGFAMYFSRAPIPFTREGSLPAPAWRHIGLYVYRRDTLLRVARLPPSAIEKAEALEQLRALAHGVRIKCVETSSASIGVDTPADLARVRALVAGRQGEPLDLRSTVHG
jgi:3-deoxy-manno-octulosonate cytidylyltransferase (CMP-KDO synthetase)